MLKVISQSKDGLSRQVVHLGEIGGMKNRSLPTDPVWLPRPSMCSTTRHQWKVNGKWQETNFDIVK